MKKHSFQYPEDIKDGAVIRLIENSKRTEEEHAHPFVQIVFILRGRLTHYINNASAEMTATDMAIIPPNVKHSVSLGDDVSYYALSFHLSILGEINAWNEEAILFIKSLENSTLPISSKTALRNREILHTEEIFKRIESEISNKEAGYRQSVAAYILLLINSFIRRYSKDEAASEANNQYSSRQAVRNCIKFMDGHITDNLSLPEMARSANVSVSTYSYYFKQLTGKSFVEYVKYKRISYANELIKKGYEISVVSSLCGFGDFSNFSRSYKQVMGVSPSAYRKSTLK